MRKMRQVPVENNVSVIVNANELDSRLDVVEVSGKRKSITVNKRFERKLKRYSGELLYQ